MGVSGPVFGAQDNFVGLGIFFDTYSNVKQVLLHPSPIPSPMTRCTPQSHQQYVSLMLNDGTRSYNQEEDGGADKLAG